MLSPQTALDATILLVEDDAATRELFRNALIASRYSVVTAGDGLSALKLIEQRDPAIVVLDLGLPQVSGWDLYHELRQRWSKRSLPIIVVSGNELRDIPSGDLAAYLQKPVDPIALVTAVDHTLRQSR